MSKTVREDRLCFDCKNVPARGDLVLCYHDGSPIVPPNKRRRQNELCWSCASDKIERFNMNAIHGEDRFYDFEIYKEDAFKPKPTRNYYNGVGWIEE